MKLVFENAKGQTIRTVEVRGEEAVLVRCLQTRRLEVHGNVGQRATRKKKFAAVARLEHANLAREPFVVPAEDRKAVVQIRLARAGEAVLKDEASSEENATVWPITLTIVASLVLLFLIFALRTKLDPAVREQEMKTAVVQIIKQAPPPPPPPKIAEQTQPQPEKTETPPPTKKAVNVKRLGALSLLGQLSKSQQKSGLNLNAAVTTAGAGLGGIAGSGGTQTALYGKGLVAAPVGPGANLQGGGGYGTKGRGGGKEGYGTMSLVGSSGAATIPVGQDAKVDPGLDRDLIAGVISKNMGQIRFCYEQGLQTDPSLAGRVAIAFVIGSAGQVKTASVESSTLNSKVVEDCIALRLRSWRFPLPARGVDVKVTYPFVLRRAGQG